MASIWNSVHPTVYFLFLFSFLYQPHSVTAAMKYNYVKGEKIESCTWFFPVTSWKTTRTIKMLFKHQNLWQTDQSKDHLRNKVLMDQLFLTFLLPLSHISWETTHFLSHLLSSQLSYLHMKEAVLLDSGWNKTFYIPSELFFASQTSSPYWKPDLKSF